MAAAAGDEKQRRGKNTGGTAAATASTVVNGHDHEHDHERTEEEAAAAAALSLLEIPMGVVQFYENLWGNTTDSAGTGGGNGTHMLFYPTQVLETWQCPGWPVNESDCPSNDMPTVAGLHMVLEKLGHLPDSIASPIQKAHWAALKARVPPLPSAGGKHIPCSTCFLGGTGPGSHRTSNCENGELYAVHPYRQATVARGDASALLLAKAAFVKPVSGLRDVGWNQVAMDAALLGEAGAAAGYVTARAKTPPAQGYRFPAFAPHEQDYEPSADHFAVFANALQYMLVQRMDDAEDDSVLLLPAWPCAWDVEFRVAAPRSTSVQGSLRNGTLTFTVDPPSRASAVRAAKCQSPLPPPTPPPTPPINCSVWQCTCQGLSDWFGADNAVGWGCTPPAAREWWEQHRCHTVSQKYPCKDPPAPCNAPGCRHL